jgi:hypothetical protein
MGREGWVKKGEAKEVKGIYQENVASYERSKRRIDAYL